MFMIRTAGRPLGRLGRRQRKTILRGLSSWQIWATKATTTPRWFQRVRGSCSSEPIQVKGFLGDNRLIYPANCGELWLNH